MRWELLDQPQNVKNINISQQVKLPDVSDTFVLYVVPCRARRKQSRAEDAEQNQTFYFIWWKKSKKPQKCKQASGGLLEHNIREELQEKS